MKRKSLFDVSLLSGIQMKNRLVRSATWEGLADQQGRVTPQLVELYRDLAVGGVGLIISSYMFVAPEGQQNIGQLSAADDDCLDGLKLLSDCIHSSGGKVVAQLVHCGGQSNREISGLAPVAPSAVLDSGYREIPVALRKSDLERIKESFVQAGLRIQKSGFDGIQLHAAHGYLLSEFLSPLRNKRTDNYGGSLENRCRFILEVYQALRESVGEAYPIMAKTNSSDFVGGGTTIEDACFLAGELAKAGIAAIEISGGTPGARSKGAVRPDITSRKDEAYFLDPARRIRESVGSIPLMLVGGIRSLEVIEEILHEGTVDYFSMSRPLIREPDLPKRWETGDRRKASCRSCLGCFRPARKGEGIRCVRKEGKVNGDG